MTLRAKILVLGSDSTTMELVETTVRSMGADACCLSSSEQVGEFINKEKVDGVFLDWDSPQLNGEVLAGLIRGSKSNSKIPIAMLTERRDTRAVAEGFKAGVSFFLSKPASKKGLSQLLNASRGAMLEERRRYQRVPLTVPVVCAWGQEQAKKTVAGKSINISSTGMQMSLFPQPDTGIAVSSEFKLPKLEKTLALRGMVTRTGPGKQVGIQFSRVSDEQRQLLETYVASSLSSTARSC